MTDTYLTFDIGTTASHRVRRRGGECARTRGGRDTPAPRSPATSRWTPKFTGRAASQARAGSRDVGCPGNRGYRLQLAGRELRSARRALSAAQSGIGLVGLRARELTRAGSVEWHQRGALSGHHRLPVGARGADAVQARLAARARAGDAPSGKVRVPARPADPAADRRDRDRLQHRADERALRLAHRRVVRGAAPGRGRQRRPAPALARPATRSELVRPEAAEALGIAPGATVCLGCNDQLAGAIGAGNVRPGIVSETTGTALAVVATTAELLDDARFYVGRHAVPGLSYAMPYAAVSAAVLTWFRDLCAGADYDALTAAAAQVPPGSDDLTVLPHSRRRASPGGAWGAGRPDLGHGRGHSRGRSWRVVPACCASWWRPSRARHAVPRHPLAGALGTQTCGCR